MKIPRLPEIDLARFCGISSDDSLRRALERHKAGGGSWSYEPVRNSTDDILNARTPLLGVATEVPWVKIASQISKASTRDIQDKANREVGKVLFEGCRRLGWKAAKVEMGRLAIGFGEAVRFWCDVVAEDEEGVFIPFFDHRREHGVANAETRLIIYSMQHHRVRVLNPDLADARLAIVRFPSTSSGRGIDLQFCVDEEALLSFDDLDTRVRHVYAMWAEVFEGRTAAERATGTSEPTPFGF